MKKDLLMIIWLMFIVIPVAGVIAGEGTGKVKIGYTLMDEEGSRAVQHAAFNQYEGFGLTLENFSYRFNNGIRLNADLKNLTLNNRILNLAVEKSGLFGLRVNNHQYRRIYDFNGRTYTRRHQTGASLWLIPLKYITLFGGGTYTGKSGRMSDLFDLSRPAVPVRLDYTQTDYNAGVRINYRGRMLQADYRGAAFNDEEKSWRDQVRYKYRVVAVAAIPRFERLILSGGFQHFETRYDETDFKISANTVWGGVTVKLPMNYSVRYGFYFDRTSSDSDLVATDNLSQAVYVTRIWPNRAGVTLGYQHDINDDFEDAFKAHTGFFSGWLKPGKNWEFRGEYGFRQEDVDDGGRLLGNEDRDRIQLSARYRDNDKGSAVIKFESKNRRNDQLGSKADFDRIAFDGTLKVKEYGRLTGGYALAEGTFDNDEQAFEFRDHLFHTDLATREFYHFTAGFGAVYYRSKGDLDTESFTVRFNLACNFIDDYLLEMVYNVHNFDNFLVWDEYYTANIVEINIIKSISF